ncbi:LuxR C-terminal-related transcriptional regulator [Paremcibacter congregatus]|uniref:HTH luxR-type domain-containing protein n=1 Tax=Paremcibacter congregatus TaxID=2043170 RepID=A0A2G4YW73_9PROT|nr:LuxR C-terminal-related transcriptional regulator [Paremcibacter congregatus]PHZ86575.1 hypothetical protein CRD36_01465 [Paremcibacter congregatus]QDE26380.1 hypothetical protein FIV45_03340 [Paremcibacter congregatus]|tara:strand:- start:395 stop:3118 length:2724 start_codon:yes stop_codon:yes gene_type:complete
MRDSNEIDREVGSWLISTKWLPPRHHVSVIRRSRLINVLDNGIQHDLTVITAPAGFGKTTLLSQWRQRLLAKNVKVAWLTLDEYDSDLNNLLCYIIFSLISSGLDLGRLEMLAEQGLSDTSPRSCLGLLLAKISELDESVVLILDDYHRIKAPEIDQFMDRLLDNMPDNFHLVINSREKPGFDLTKIRSFGQLQEFGPQELRFDTVEMKEVIGLDLSDEQYSRLLEKTEGWPVTIQLASQFIALGENKEQVLDSFSGKTSHLADYLSAQIMNKCPEVVQEFLIKTSVLERVNDNLAYAICGIEGGFDQLEDAGSINALFVPLDEEKKWFRYHHLFSEFLKELLHKRYLNEIPSLHLKASKWFEADNNLNEAVRHACLAGDYDLAAQLIENAGGWELILYGGIGYIRNLLHHIPDEQFADYPRLQVARAYYFQKKGEIREARNYIEFARCNPKLRAEAYRGNLPAFHRDFDVVEVLQNTYEDDFVANNLVTLTQRIKKLDPEDGISPGVLFCSLSLSMMANGKFDEGLKFIQEGIRSMRQANSVLGLNYCYVHLGQFSLYQGHLRQAEAYFREAQNMADENFGSDSGLKYIADVSLFSLRDWRGEGGDDMTQVMMALDHIEEFDGWFEIYISAYEMILVRACRERKKSLIVELRDRCQRVVSERSIERLSVFVQCCDLMVATLEENRPDAERILYQMQGSLKWDRGQSDPMSWRPLQYMGKAAALWYMKIEDFTAARALLVNMEECCREVKATCFLLNILIMRAELEFRQNNMARASDFLFEAAALAWPENIIRPFTENDNIVPLVAAAYAVRRQKNVDRLALNFLQECAAQARKMKKVSLLHQELLSSREMEVLMELQGGLSNKEIARALEMTEHTVKFHLKNIFVKLDVDKRAKAIIVARQKGLLG